MAGAYTELHCHSSFSFLDGASSAEELAAAASALGCSALAVTDHQGLYGAVRFASALREVGLRPIIGLEIELLDSAVPDPAGLVMPNLQPGGRGPSSRPGPAAGRTAGSPGVPRRPLPERLRPPGHRQPRREDLRGVRPRELGPHLVLLASDMSGYRSLCRLVSAAHMAGTKGVPRFTHRLIAEHRQGLIALSGCRHGEIARRLLAGDRQGAAAAARWLSATYDDDRFHVELQHHLLPDDDWLVTESVRLADDLGLPMVVTNDVHYARPEGRELQDVLVCIRHGLTLDSSAHLRRPNGEYHLKSAEQMAILPPGDGSLGPRVAAAWAEGMGRSVAIAERCSVNLEFEQYRFPGFPVPAGETPFSELERLCHEGARKRYHPLTPAVVKQLAHELEVIERTGLAEFFLICWDLMRFCRERGIPAQGRGSAGDSIVAYVLGITRVDPIRHQLLFERFINEGRTTYPDVDIDFATSRREEVIQYCYERYGPEHTGMVCNVVTYRARSAVREVGQALGFPRPLVDRVAKALETYDSVMVRRDLEAEGGFAEFFTPTESSPESASRLAESRGVLDGMGRLRVPSDDEGGPGDTAVSVRWLKGGVPRIVPAEPTDDYRPAVLRRSMLAKQAPDAPGAPDAADPSGWSAGRTPWDRWLDLTAQIAELPRHLSIHTGGMLITQAPLVDIAPLERASMPGRVVVQYDKRDIETIKLIKLDLLGLRMLSAIDDALRDIYADCAVHLDLDRLPEDIPDVFRMICAADTVGVFQIESRAQMQTLPRSRPQNLDDLVVEVAIIRPGPIQGNAVHPYLRRRQGKEPISYLHPSLKPALQETLGVILYQEQVMKIAIDVAGFSAAESDGFRRAMGTWRSSKEMEKLHARFVDGCVTRSGLTIEQAEELFRQVAAFASFGFNKSHAAAFARTAYESAFLKLFYPAQFVTGLINAQPMGFYPVEVLVNDAKRHGVSVLPVDVNRSRFRTSTEWVGLPGAPLPEGAGIARRPRPVRSTGCVVPGPAARRHWSATSAQGYGIRLGLHLVKGIGEAEGEAIDAARAADGQFRSLADLVSRTELPEEVIERLIRAGALDSLGVPRRQLLWQLREVAGAARGRYDGRAVGSKKAAGRPLDLGLPPTAAPDLPPPSELERLGDAYAILSLDARRQVVELFRPALDRLGAMKAGQLVDSRPGKVRVGGLVVTRQHPMTAHGTVFLALEDETGMVNVTLWPDTWARFRSTVRRHALLYVEGRLERESEVVNVIAHSVRSLAEIGRPVGGPLHPVGVRQMGHAGMRRLG
ncbi:MAG TPA: PHP domain-containing protein [Candidatus Limnocylindrales bacterium]|nr:PHP domain-containing protein [Candidatus Limnocylindrales bacterium]